MTWQWKSDAFLIYPSVASAVNLHHVYDFPVLRERGENVSFKNPRLPIFLLRLFEASAALNAKTPSVEPVNVNTAET